VSTKLGHLAGTAASSAAIRQALLLSAGTAAWQCWQPTAWLTFVDGGCPGVGHCDNCTKHRVCKVLVMDVGMSNPLVSLRKPAHVATWADQDQC
jgi:hypothetical protein